MNDTNERACPICGRGFVTEPEVLDHIRQEHDRQLPWIHCDLPLPEEDDVREALGLEGSE